MIQMIAVDAFDVETLFRFMDEHGLISSALRRAPGLLANMQRASSYCIWNDGANPLALMLEIPLPEEGVMELVIIPEDKSLGKQRDDLVEFSKKLRGRWFDCLGMRRIQSHVPASRVNMQRIMRWLGFVEETKKGVGLRNAIRLGDKPEAIIVYGLLEGDPIKITTEHVEVQDAVEQ